MEQPCQHVNLIRLLGVVRYLVDPRHPTAKTLMDYLEPLARVEFQVDGNHQSPARIGPVSRLEVDMLGEQAQRAVIAIVAPGMGDDHLATILAYESCVFCRSANAPTSSI